jgi:hypothetical protein
VWFVIVNLLWLSKLDFSVEHGNAGREDLARRFAADDNCRPAVGAMGAADDISLRLKAQRALLIHVTPALRAVSMDIDVDRHRVRARFIFDGKPSDPARDAAACAGTEILSDYPDGWDITEESVVCPAPSKIDHLRVLVCHRCEDSQVHE